MTPIRAISQPPRRAAAILVCMIAVVGVTQLVALGRHASPGPVAPPPAGPDALAQPAPADLDTGTGLATGDREELARVKADVAFWSARYAKNHLDFVSATQWGANE